MSYALYGQDPATTVHTSDSFEKNVHDHPKDPYRGILLGIYSGYGWNSPGSSQCYPDQWTGGWVFGAKAGLRISKRFAADMLIHLWAPGSDLWKDQVDYMRMTAAMHLEGYYFPLPTPFFFLKASAGYNVFHFTPSEPVIPDNGVPMRGTLSADGLGFGLGIGYSWMISDHVALTPALNYQYQPFHQLKGGIPGQVVSGAEGSGNFHLSLGLDLYYGGRMTRREH